MLTALQRHFTIISMKVWKLRREQEWSMSTAGETMTEPEVSRSWRNISSDGASQSRIAADRLFNVHFHSHFSALTQKPKVQDQYGAR